MDIENCKKYHWTQNNENTSFKIFMESKIAIGG